MRKEIPTFDSYVIKGILANNEFNIKNIQGLESIKTMNLDRTSYPEIGELIKKKDFKAIRELPIGTRSSEYLEIMKFSDQKNKEYVVTVYSSDELSQDPQVIDLFQL